jgi:hypothetical protein
MSGSGILQSILVVARLCNSRDRELRPAREIPSRLMRCVSVCGQRLVASIEFLFRLYSYFLEGAPIIFSTTPTPLKNSIWPSRRELRYASRYAEKLLATSSPSPSSASHSYTLPVDVSIKSREFSSPQKGRYSPFQFLLEPRKVTVSMIFLLKK